MRLNKKLIFATAMFTAFAANANEWVIGNVSLLEDYRAYNVDQAIMITLSNKSYYVSGQASSVCTERFRVVVGQEGVTADVQKNIFALALAARLSGDKVRLYVSSTNNLGSGFCAVQIASIGDL